MLLEAPQASSGIWYFLADEHHVWMEETPPVQIFKKSIGIIVEFLIWWVVNVSRVFENVEHEFCRMHNSIISIIYLQDTMES